MSHVHVHVELNPSRGIVCCTPLWLLLLLLWHNFPVRLINSIDGSALNLQQLPHWSCMPRKFVANLCIMHYLHSQLVSARLDSSQLGVFGFGFAFGFVFIYVFHFVAYLWQRQRRIHVLARNQAKPASLPAPYPVHHPSPYCACWLPHSFVDKATGQAATGFCWAKQQVARSKCKVASGKTFGKFSKLLLLPHNTHSTHTVSPGWGEARQGMVSRGESLAWMAINSKLSWP